MRNPRSTVIILVLAFCSVAAHAQTAYMYEVKQSASHFINSLEPLKKKVALLRFDDTARMKWNNLPIGLRARAGISIGAMSEEQRRLLHRLLSVSLSSQGYLKATSIMHLDNLLNDFYDSLFANKKINERMLQNMRNLQWSHKNFYLAFFGLPGDSLWGYKIEGHHLSVNFSFVNNKLSIAPFFIGTDPAEYMIGEYAGWRVLGQEEDLGIKLAKSLSASQLKKATISNEVPGDIFTSAESGKRLLDYQGIKASELNTAQKKLIQHIIREYVFNFEYDKASEEFNKILKAGIDNIYFGWIGPVDESQKHYFVLNGPNFIIEFDNNGFGAANHIHTIWREKGNDFGEDILKKHYQQSHQ